MNDKALDRKGQVEEDDGPDCTKTCRSIEHGRLIYAIGTKGSDVEVINVWIKTCNNYSRVKDDLRRSAIHVASSKGRLRVVLWLIKKCRVNINSRQLESGYTPLHLSLLFRQIHVAKSLIELGANISLTDNEGFTAFDLLKEPERKQRALYLEQETEREYHPFLDTVAFVSGSNDNYSLGIARPNSGREIPEEVQFLPPLHRSAKVLLQKYHSVFITAVNDSKVYVTGTGPRLGISSESAITPTVIPFNVKEVNCIAVAAGPDHTLFLMKNGSVWSCGSNENFVLGLEKLDSRDRISNPRCIQTLKTYEILYVAASANHSVFANGGRIFVCGTNLGQLGFRKAPNMPDCVRQPKLAIDLSSRSAPWSICIQDIACNEMATVIGCKVSITVFYQYNIYRIIQEKDFTSFYRCPSENLLITKVRVGGGRNYNEHLFIFIMMSRYNDRTRANPLREVLLFAVPKEVAVLKNSATRILHRIQFDISHPICDMEINNSGDIFIVSGFGSIFRGCWHAQWLCDGEKLPENYENLPLTIKIKRIPSISNAWKVFCHPKEDSFAITQVFQVALRQTCNYEIELSTSDGIVCFSWSLDRYFKYFPNITRASVAEWMKKLSCPAEENVVEITSHNKLYDVILLCINGVKIGAHRSILSDKLPYFGAMFGASYYWAESTQEVPTLTFPFSSSAVKWILFYAYDNCFQNLLRNIREWDDSTGVMIKEDMETLVEMIKMVDMFECPILKNITEKTLANYVNHRTAPDILILAHRFNARHLLNCARRFICLSIPYFLENRLLDSLDEDILIDISRHANQVPFNMWKNCDLGSLDLENNASFSSEVPSDEAYNDAKSPISIGELESLIRNDDDEIDKQEQKNLRIKQKMTVRVKTRTYSDSGDLESVFKIEDSFSTSPVSLPKPKTSNHQINSIGDTAKWQKVASAEQKRQKQIRRFSEEPEPSPKVVSPQKSVRVAGSPRSQPVQISRKSLPILIPLKEQAMKDQNRILQRQDNPKFESISDFPSLGSSNSFTESEIIPSPNSLSKSSTNPTQPQSTSELKGKKKVKWVTVNLSPKNSKVPVVESSSPVPVSSPPNPWNLDNSKSFKGNMINLTEINLRGVNSEREKTVVDFQKIIEEEERKFENYRKATRKPLKLLQIEELAIEQFRTKFTTLDVVEGLEQLEVRRCGEGNTQYSEPVWPYERKRSSSSGAVGGAGTLDKLFNASASSTTGENAGPSTSSSGRRQRFNSTNEDFPKL